VNSSRQGTVAYRVYAVQAKELNPIRNDPARLLLIL